MKYLKESYLIKICFCSKKYFAVWEADENGNDSFVKLNDAILITQSKNKIPQDIFLADISIYDFDKTREMLYGGLKNINYEELLSFWNLTQDAADTINYKFAAHKKKYDKIYDEIFHATSAGRIVAKNPNELYMPQLTKDDLQILAEILAQSFEMWSEIISGISKNAAKEKLRKDFAYNCKSNRMYYPLNRVAPKQDHFFVMQGTLEPYNKMIIKYLTNNYANVFCLQECAWSRDVNDYELIDLESRGFGYRGGESVIFPPNYSFLIYFSHEGTITFVGEIVGDIKKILAPITHKFNKSILV